MLFAIPFPAIDPVAVEIGPVVIRWYALAYIAGLLLGWRLMFAMARRQPQPPSPRDLDDFFLWATLGVVLGGRLGEILFYQPAYYFADPVRMLKVWTGGMSFHGGLLGVSLAIYVFARVRKVHPFALGDLAAIAAPIGLFFGRIANFINGELWGRPWDGPWAMVFPHPMAGTVLRHPSQLYEAAAEGLLLFLLLLGAALWTSALSRRGLLIGLLLTGYAIARFSVEFVREPGPEAMLFGWMTRGQQLCLPMAAAGLCFIAWALRRPAVAAAKG